MTLQNESEQAILDHNDYLVIDPLTSGQKRDTKTRKKLVLKRSHMLNSLDKYNSNVWNNFKRMDRKHIDQTFTKRVIQYEENAINRIGTLIEQEKVDSVCKSPRFLLGVTANFMGKNSSFANGSSFLNKHEATGQSTTFGKDPYTNMSQ